MSVRTYLDFDLQLDELDDGTFRVRVLNSPAGQAEDIFTLPFSEHELEIFSLRVTSPRRGVRHINSPEMDNARTMGGKLYNALFQGNVQDCLLRSMDSVEQEGKGLRLRLRLPPSLIKLPWEYLYDSSLDRFLSHSINTPIVRYVDLPQSIRPLAVTLPLKVLVMIASPTDYEPLDVEAEWTKINEAIAEAKERGLIQLTRLPNATLGTLQEQLRDDQYHIFHFIGHGAFDTPSDDGVLLLEDDQGRSRAVNGAYLSTLLHDHSSLRLALLNACEGGRTSQSDPFAGVAQQLLRQGIPAVIAMQNAISDAAAIVLTRAFYAALADGYPVDGALAEARKSLFTAGNNIEWGTPVLYLRAADGRLFDLSIRPEINAPSPDKKMLEKKITSLQQPFEASRTATVTPSVSQSATIHRQQRWQVSLIVASLVILVGILAWRIMRQETNTRSPTTTNTSLNTSMPKETQPTSSAVSPEASPRQSDASSIGSSDPVNRTLWLQEGYDASDEGSYDEAKRAFDRILATEPDDVDALLGLGITLQRAGEEGKALVTLDRAAKIDPENPAVNYALGTLYYEGFSNHRQAIDYLSRVIQTNTTMAQHADAYFIRALAYQALGDYEKSLADWNEVIRFEPDNSERYLRRAEVHQLMGDKESAEDDYNSAVELSPTVGQYYFVRADFYALSNRADAATKDYRAFLLYRGSDEDQAWIDKANTYIQRHSSPTPIP